MNDPKTYMRCHKCGSEQDRSHFYCDNCGYDLHKSSYESNLQGISSEQQIEQTIKSIEKRAHIVELETLEKIQERATKWAKINLFFLGLASSLLILAISVFGYKQITDLEKYSLESTDKIKFLVSQAEEKTKAANAQVKNSLIRAKELNSQLETINIQAIRIKLDKLDNLKSQFNDSLLNAERIREQVTAERQNVQKLEHSFYSISMHYDGNREQLAEHLNKIIQELNNDGFQLSSPNLIEIGVNKTEVLYYNRIAQKQAELIADIVKESLALPQMTSRIISMPERNPREILIKILFQ